MLIVSVLLKHWNVKVQPFSSEIHFNSCDRRSQLQNCWAVQSYPKKLYASCYYGNHLLKYWRVCSELQLQAEPEFTCRASVPASAPAPGGPCLFLKTHLCLYLIGDEDEEADEEEEENGVNTEQQPPAKRSKTRNIWGALRLSCFCIFIDIVINLSW